MTSGQMNKKIVELHNAIIDIAKKKFKDLSENEWKDVEDKVQRLNLPERLIESTVKVMEHCTEFKQFMEYLNFEVHISEIGRK